MKKLLFVNGCIRGEDSRTYQLCRYFIEKFMESGASGSWTVEEIELDKSGIEPLDRETLILRDNLLNGGNLDHPMFAAAKQLIEADMILIGAPYWDLSFPAKVKIYLERCSVTGLTFIYDDCGIPAGQCRADALVYLTTSGSAIGSFNFGYDYVRGLCSLFGIPETYFASAEELDIIGKDVPAIMESAKDKITEIIKEMKRYI